jgi:6-pyruvoyltetrahydropterin/6-carboxytetrahydropterin synthase
MITANRYHDICCGHRVVGHESKCKNLHGHNYRFHFSVEPYPKHELDTVGRVIDFSVIKTTLCDWLERCWDHKFLIWEKDPFKWDLIDLDAGIVVVPFNPTAENIAEFFTLSVAPSLLVGTGTRLVELTIEETRKCSVTFKI